MSIRSDGARRVHILDDSYDGCLSGSGDQGGSTDDYGGSQGEEELELHLEARSCRGRRCTGDKRR